MADDRLIETFVELADTMVDDFDVIDFLHLLVDRCVELLSVDAAGLLLADQHGKLQLIATSNEQARLLELFQLQNDDGPCLDAFATGSRVGDPGLTRASGRWPRFATAATTAGFTAVDAFPMRLRNEVIGALNLFRARPGELAGSSLRTAQALVDVATIGLLQERSIRHQEVLTEQLQAALNSRVLIEQAKGLLAERLGVDMEGAFAALRGYARGHNLKLRDVAGAVVAGQTSTDALVGGRSPSTRPER
ncbi:GAF and ANTAR domain-containing protein [Amycolatopsis cihanbeyliensis]|uniref:GAF domain-containing protein n=1 Tax=Amycolatopsis cihanbeyliensis TaxID=1128664 RepID=A0A542DGQ3_AMYCI|nr:GAF and ANTAR domain-containing protein [Amycolatopsis cihanbeyliensis]TQJ02267.1 GAF domain-containing protein [Amycolatopsis cihanbeyliensis]